MPISSLEHALTAEQFIDRAGTGGLGVGGTNVEKPTNPIASFADTLKESIQNVDNLMKDADVKMEDLVAGKGENIHDAMIAFEKAETSMKMLVQVRNKALEAYNQIIQMQV